MVSEQVLAVPSAALGMGPAVAQDGAGAGQSRIHQQASPGHGQAKVLFGSRSVSRTTKKWANMTSVA